MTDRKETSSFQCFLELSWHVAPPQSWLFGTEVFVFSAEVPPGNAPTGWCWGSLGRVCTQEDSAGGAQWSVWQDRGGHSYLVTSKWRFCFLRILSILLATHDGRISDDNQRLWDSAPQCSMPRGCEILLLSAPCQHHSHLCQTRRTARHSSVPYLPNKRRNGNLPTTYLTYQTKLHTIFTLWLCVCVCVCVCVCTYAHTDVYMYIYRYTAIYMPTYTYRESSYGKPI